jgi:TolB-like protein/Flp pilus assembly protein TadD
MFTDLVGYTALTQEKESAALEILEQHRELLRPIFSKHRGHEVKTIGDAFLVEFGSALEATLCAVDIQNSVHSLNLERGGKMQVRIGIHVGDVMHQGDDVLGDAVNISSRIYPLAEPGGVCISGLVYEQVRNKVDLPCVKLAAVSLKNVSTPMEVYKMVMPWSEEKVAPPIQLDKRRIAVLPFTNMSPDPNDEYFADGMTEELIYRLAQVKQLKVIARTSVMSYKGEKKKASQIAKELEVGGLVEGSVRKAGSRVRVTVQLISGGTEEHLWSSHYDGSMDDIFAVQSEIAEKVAGELKVQLLASEKAAIEKRPTGDTEAYTDYLQGMQLLNRLEEAPLRDALGLFQRAIERDPSFARAYAGMADCYAWLASREYIPTQEAVEKGRAAARRALELAPDLAEAHYGLAVVMQLADEHEGSLRELRRALELNPNLAEAHVALAEESASLGGVGEMVRAAEKGYQLDPLSPWAIQWLGLAYLWTGRGEEAMEHWRKTLHLEPYRTNRWMFDYYVGKGDYAKAEEVVKELERLGPTLNPTYLNRGYLSALTGDIKTAHEMITKLDPGKGEGNVNFAGFIYYALGDMGRFFECELRAAEGHALQSAVFRLSPLFEKARGDPRFGEVLRRVGLAYEPKS